VIFDSNGASGFSMSSTGTLVYLSGAVAANSDLIWVDRNGGGIVKVGGPGAYRDLALSPDETRIVYGLGEERNQSENLWVRDLRRDVASRLPFGSGTEFWPVGSPDARRIAYAADEKNGSPSLYERDAGGTGAEAPA